MKRIAIFISLLFILNSSFSQITHIELIIGKYDSQVTNYFDSLNSLKSNVAYKIKREVSDSGDLILSTEFSLTDESYYTCLSIAARFARLNGHEFCDREYIVGNPEFAKSNLDFIKDNFIFVPASNNWERIYIPDHFKIIASFEKRETFYKITYELKEID